MRLYGLHRNTRDVDDLWSELSLIQKRIADMNCVHGTKEKAKTKRAGTQTSELTKTVNMEIENPNPVTTTYIRCKKLRKKVFYTRVYLEKKKLEVEKVEKNTHMKPMKRTRHVKTVIYLKIYERNNDPILPEPSMGQSDQEKTRKGG